MDTKRSPGWTPALATVSRVSIAVESDDDLVTQLDIPMALNNIEFDMEHIQYPCSGMHTEAYLHVCPRPKKALIDSWVLGCISTHLPKYMVLLRQFNPQTPAFEHLENPFV